MTVRVVCGRHETHDGTVLRAGGTLTELRIRFRNSGCGFPAVPVVKAADARQRNQLCSRRLWVNRATIRSILAQPVMGAVGVVVSYELAGDPPDV